MKRADADGDADAATDSERHRRLSSPLHSYAHNYDATPIPLLRGVWGDIHMSDTRERYPQHPQHEQQLHHHQLQQQHYQSQRNESFASYVPLTNDATHHRDPVRERPPITHFATHSPILLPPPPAKWHLPRASSPTALLSFTTGAAGAGDAYSAATDDSLEGEASPTDHTYQHQQSQQSPTTTLATHLHRQSLGVLRPPLPPALPLPSSRSPIFESTSSSSARSTITPTTPALRTSPTTLGANTPSAAAMTGKKRTRYLRDTDRRAIIQRIDAGERQAALAREFGVTRAAVCHIKKNRDEIITRYDSLMQSVMELESSGTGPSSDAATTPMQANDSIVVLEAQSHAVSILLTTLRDTTTSAVTFQRAASRLIMILLEDALARFGSQSVEVSTPSGHAYLGRRQVDRLCGVALGEAGDAFLTHLCQIEPDVATSSVHVVVTDGLGIEAAVTRNAAHNTVDIQTTAVASTRCSATQQQQSPARVRPRRGTRRRSRSNPSYAYTGGVGVDGCGGGGGSVGSNSVGSSSSDSSSSPGISEVDETMQANNVRWRVEQSNVPLHVAACNTLLVSATISDGARVCCVLDALCALNVQPARLCIVSVLCGADALEMIRARFPAVKVVTAAVDAGVNARTGELIPGLGDFLERYNSE